MNELRNDPGEITTWSVNDILDNYSNLGIPHFQRGLVWNDSNTVQLLESLYFGTPCGNIILWKPPIGREGKDYGEPLVRSENDPQYMIIDGQQRIRTLYGIKKEIDAQPKDDDAGVEGVPYVLAVNLQEFAKLPEFAELLKSEGIVFKPGKVNSLFVKIKDPVRQKLDYIDYAKNKIEDGKAKSLSPEYRNQYNFVPIRIIMKRVLPSDMSVAANDGAERKCFSSFRKAPETKNICLGQLDDLKNKVRDNTIFVDLGKSGVDVIKFIDALHNKLMQIFCRQFPVHILHTGDMSDIIHTYIRINSGGRAVQQEEKTIARLVQLCPEHADGTAGGSFSAIAKLFEEIHGSNCSDDINDHFQRVKETKFGFKLFVRVFVLAASYHTGRAIGSQTMNFSAIENNDELESPAGRRAIPQIWEVVEKVTMAVKELLENALHIDSLAFLPDSRSLWPVFMILIKHPQFIDGSRICDAWRNHFAYILLTLLLGAGDSETATVGVMKDIREFAGDGRSLLDKMVGGNISGKDQDRWKNITDAIAPESLMAKLANANALTNRYTLLLYALERHLGAVDFYGNALPVGIRGNFPAGCLIGKDIVPEKQHIVPYSALNSGDQDAELNKGRKNNDKSNNIGNITYISQKLNSYKTGLGSQWLELDENQTELNGGHIISKCAVNKYKAMFNEKDDKKPSTGDSAYKEWIGQRQLDIATAFEKWRTDLMSAASQPDDGGFIPHARMLIPPQENNDENEAGDKNTDSAGKEAVFTWLAYLSEIWNVPDFSPEKRCELARCFGEAKRALVRKSDGTYVVLVGKKQIWPPTDTISPCR